MTNELTLLTKENFGGIELDFYRNTENEIFMTIAQLAEALEYASKSAIENMLNRNPELKEGEFSSTHALWVGQNSTNSSVKSQETRFFTEDGIYEITMLSKQPKAREFRSFIRKLLKGLRKNELTVVSNSPSYTIEDPIARAEQWIAEQKNKIALEQTVAEYKPKVQYYDEVLQSDNLMTVTQIAKEFGMYAKQLNLILHKKKIQFKNNGQWLLYSQYQDKGYTKSVTSLDPFGKTGSTEGALHVYTKWTQKGREFIHSILAKDGIYPQ